MPSGDPVRFDRRERDPAGVNPKGFDRPDIPPETGAVDYDRLVEELAIKHRAKAAQASS